MLDDFSKEDINEKFYYLADVLPGQISCRWRETGKSCRLSAGECRTIQMMEQSLEISAKDFEIIKILLMAYFRDLDPILCRSLPGKTMGKLHRLMTNEEKYWIRNNKDLYGFWHKNCRTYLPLTENDRKSIEDKMMGMSLEERTAMFESEDIGPFVAHFCSVVDLAFGNKEFYLKTFSIEACEAALEKLESGADSQRNSIQD